MSFVRSPGFDTPTELVSWLLHHDVEPSNMRLEKGADGQWRGSGRVTQHGETTSVVAPVAEDGAE